MPTVNPIPADKLPNLWKELDTFQSQFTQVHGALSEGRDKQMLGELLEQFQVARQQAEELLPATVAELKAKNEGQRSRLTEVQASFEKMKQHLEQLRKASEEKLKAPPLAAPSPPPVPPIDVNRGAFLGGDLLRTLQIAGPTVAPRMRDEGSVAKHWAEGEEPAKPPTAKPEVADEWPEELRTPIFKKRSADDAEGGKKKQPKPPPKPVSNDESIGNDWGDEGESLR